MKKIYSLLLLCTAVASHAADSLQVYPSHWWTGMVNPKLQLMLYGKNISSAAATVKIAYPGVRVDKVSRVDNSNYLFIDLTVTTAARPGKFSIQTNSQFPALQYELRA